MGGECETDGSWHVSRPAFTYSVNSLSHGILYTVSAEPEGSEAWRVVGRLEGTKTQAEVAQAIGVSQSVISRIWNRFLETGSAGRRPGQGRRWTTKPNEDRFLVLTARRHRNMNATLLQQHLRSATESPRVAEQCDVNIKSINQSLGYWHHCFNSDCPKPAAWCRSVCSPIDGMC
ncbi:transposable element Tcb2 transposase [Trichonephila clavipes]|nr:transposable element Tcb2 transposase [Trichonephila clavipes]